MTALLLAPAALSALLLAAHFLRAGTTLPMLLALALLPLLAVHRRWARRTLQLALALAALEWLRTALGLARYRLQAGEPWARMALILGAVALIAALSALLLESRRLRARDS